MTTRSQRLTTPEGISWGQEVTTAPHPEPELAQPVKVTFAQEHFQRRSARKAARLVRRKAVLQKELKQLQDSVRRREVELSQEQHRLQRTAAARAKPSTKASKTDASLAHSNLTAWLASGDFVQPLWVGIADSQQLQAAQTTTAQKLTAKTELESLIRKRAALERDVDAASQRAGVDKSLGSVACSPRRTHMKTAAARDNVPAWLPGGVLREPSWSGIVETGQPAYFTSQQSPIRPPTQTVESALGSAPAYLQARPSDTAHELYKDADLDNKRFVTSYLTDSDKHVAGTIGVDQSVFSEAIVPDEIVYDGVNEDTEAIKNVHSPVDGYDFDDFERASEGGSNLTDANDLGTTRDFGCSLPTKSQHRLRFDLTEPSNLSGKEKESEAQPQRQQKLICQLHVIKTEELKNIVQRRARAEAEEKQLRRACTLRDTVAVNIKMQRLRHQEYQMRQEEEQRLHKARLKLERQAVRRRRCQVAQRKFQRLKQKKQSIKASRLRSLIAQQELKVAAEYREQDVEVALTRSSQRKKADALLQRQRAQERVVEFRYKQLKRESTIRRAASRNTRERRHRSTYRSDLYDPNPRLHVVRAHTSTRSSIDPVSESPRTTGRALAHVRTAWTPTIPVGPHFNA